MSRTWLFDDPSRVPGLRPVPPGDRPFAMALCALPGVGPARSRRLFQLAGSYRAAWEAGPRALPRLGVAGLRGGPAFETAWSSLSPEELPDTLRELGLAAVFEGDPGYPQGLCFIRGAPLVVYIRGEIRPGDRCAVAVVGTRRMSAYGQWMASRLASGLAREGLTVVGGLARGVDSVAHREALRAGGRTIAVLPGGPDVVYPPEHAGLAEEIAARGALISEYLPGTPVVPGNFPARNRLISGLAAATVVVEAGVKSGALITAGFALDQGREVLAVPGRVGSPGSGGVHALLRDGAGLVETAADVVVALPTWAKQELSAGAGAAGPGVAGRVRDVTPSSGARPLGDRLLQLLAGGPLAESALIQASGGTPAEVRAALVILEMEDRLQRLPGAIYAAREPEDASYAPEVELCKGP